MRITAPASPSFYERWTSRSNFDPDVSRTRVYLEIPLHRPVSARARARRVQSTIISSTGVRALAARYMHLNLISGAKGKDGWIAGGRVGPVTPFATATPTNGTQPPLAAATAARSWLQLLQLSAHVIRAHYAEPRPLYACGHLALPSRSRFRLPPPSVVEARTNPADSS